MDLCGGGRVSAEDSEFLTSFIIALEKLMMSLYFTAILLMWNGKLFVGDCCGGLVMSMPFRER